MTITVYVKLQNEGTDVWRPVDAELVGKNRYKVLSRPTDDENWPVTLGEVVECERRMPSGEDCLVVKD